MNIYNEILSKEHVSELVKQVQIDLKKLQYLENEILNLEEAQEYLSMSKTDLYAKISYGEIPFYSTEEKRFYFRRSELEYWVFSGKISTADDFGKEIQAYLSKVTIC